MLRDAKMAFSSMRMCLSGPLAALMLLSTVFLPFSYSYSWVSPAISAPGSLCQRAVPATLFGRACPHLRPANVPLLAPRGRGTCLVSPPCLRKRMSMAASEGAGDGEALAKAEAALDSAIEDGDVEAMSKCIKEIENLQVAATGEAGGAPWQKKTMSKEELAAEVQDLLGRLDDGAADEVADALTGAGLEDMAVELQVAEAAVEWAVENNDASALRLAMGHLSELQVCGRHVNLA